jgi:hypothetical protein
MELLVVGPEKQLWYCKSFLLSFWVSEPDSSHTESIPATQSAYEQYLGGILGQMAFVQKKKKKNIVWLFKILLHLANLLLHNRRGYRNLAVVLLCSQECQFKV